MIAQYLTFPIHSVILDLATLVGAFFLCANFYELTLGFAQKRRRK